MDTGMKRWISQERIKNQKPLAHRFLRNTPFPHIILKGFLYRSKAENMRKALLQERFHEQSSDLFQFRQTHDVKHTKNKMLKEFYDFFSSREFITFISHLTHAKLARTIDMSGFIYSSTDYLLPHDDRLEGRKIAYVLNLSKNFTKKDGGGLELFQAKSNMPIKMVKRIMPSFNTLVLFNVNARSFHQVCEILTGKKRISIGGWFHG